MLPFKKVLCPTDFSAPSCEALSTAVEFAKAFSAPLVLVHVVQPIPAAASASEFPIDVEALEAALLREAERRLHELAHANVPKSVPTTVRAVRGSVAHEILQVAQVEGADLIVISTHGETGFRHFLLGSVAERIVRTAHCPVLTVRCSPPSGSAEVPRKESAVRSHRKL